MDEKEQRDFVWLMTSGLLNVCKARGVQDDIVADILIDNACHLSATGHGYTKAAKAMLAVAENLADLGEWSDWPAKEPSC